jgi:hypothetical protein
MGIVESELVFLRYRDHVLYSRIDPASIKPQVRECVGWLIYQSDEYVVVAWDRDTKPTLRGEGLKASGLVLLCSDILELKRIG